LKRAEDKVMGTEKKERLEGIISRWDLGFNWVE
jgi:hypothetical protein